MKKKIVLVSGKLLAHSQFGAFVDYREWLAGVEVKLPIKVGQIIVLNICSAKTDLIVCQSF